jgi:hypothetical protein
MLKEYAQAIIRNPMGTLRNQFKLHPPTDAEASALLDIIERQDATIELAEKLTETTHTYLTEDPTAWVDARPNEYINRRVDDRTTLQQLALQVFETRLKRLTVKDWSGYAELNLARDNTPMCTLIGCEDAELGDRAALSLAARDIIVAAVDGGPRLLVWVAPYDATDEDVKSYYADMFLQVTERPLPEFEHDDARTAFIDDFSMQTGIFLKVIKLSDADAPISDLKETWEALYDGDCTTVFYCNCLSKVSGEHDIQQAIRTLRNIAIYDGTLVVSHPLEFVTFDRSKYRGHPNLTQEVDVELYIQLTDGKLLSNLTKDRSSHTATQSTATVELPTMLL